MPRAGDDGSGRHSSTLDRVSCARTYANTDTYEIAGARTAGAWRVEATNVFCWKS